VPRNPLTPTTERIADGVWRHAGDLRRAMNVYFIEDNGGVLQFDAGTETMTERAAEAAKRLGGLTRVVLGHSHADHRGTAPGLGVPVLYPWVLSNWDGGPVRIADTVTEGDEVGGFRVIHFPGHAPGQIALWRERDRLALVSDTVYLVDSMRLRRADHPSVPAHVFNLDHAAAVASVRKLAALEPRTVWTGHTEALVGEPHQLRAILERAADAG